MNIKEFELPATIHQKLSSKSLLGKWSILYFYPKDNTPGCTTQACDFTSHYQDFQSLGCEIVGINDNPIKMHEKFQEKYSIPYPLVTDEDRSFLEAMGVWKLKKFMGKEYMGIVRTTLIVNPKGEIVKRYDEVKTKGHTEQVLADLRALMS